MSWSWALLGWGAAIGCVGSLGSYFVGRRAELNPNRWRAYSGFVAMSGAVALLSAGFDSPWPLIVFGGYVAIANFAVPLILLPRLRQPAAHRCGSASPSCSAAACATCPLAGAATQ